MLKITTGLAAAALLLVTASAQAGDQKNSKSAQAEGSQASANARVTTPRMPEYLNVAGFKGSVNDPLYSFAAVPAPAPTPRPTVSSFPLPYAVWW
jgi:hypothetical protein